MLIQTGRDIVAWIDLILPPGSSTQQRQKILENKAQILMHEINRYFSRDPQAPLEVRQKLDDVRRAANDNKYSLLSDQLLLFNVECMYAFF